MRIIEGPLFLKSGFLQLSSGNTPDPGPANAARIWYDSGANAIKWSLGGGAFSNNPGAIRFRDLTEFLYLADPPAVAAEAALLFDGGATPFAGSASGTFLGLNSSAAYAGNFIDAQDNAVSVFRLTATGAVLAGGTTNLAQVTVLPVSGTTSGLVVRAAVASPTNPWFQLQNSAGTEMAAFGGSSPRFSLTNQTFGYSYNGIIATVSRLSMISDTAAAVLFHGRAIGGQTGNLLELQATADSNAPRFSVGNLTQVTNVHLTMRAVTGQTGNYITGRNAANTLNTFAFLPDGRGVFAAPPTAVADASLHASSLSFYTDAGETNVIVKVKLADGTTIKTGSIAIA